MRAQQQHDGCQATRPDEPPNRQCISKAPRVALAKHRLAKRPRRPKSGPHASRPTGRKSIHLPADFLHDERAAPGAKFARCQAQTILRQRAAAASKPFVCSLAAMAGRVAIRAGRRADCYLSNSEAALRCFLNYARAPPRRRPNGRMFLLLSRQNLDLKARGARLQVCCNQARGPRPDGLFRLRARQDARLKPNWRRAGAELAQPNTKAQARQQNTAALAIYLAVSFPPASGRRPRRRPASNFSRSLYLRCNACVRAADANVSWAPESLKAARTGGDASALGPNGASSTRRGDLFLASPLDRGRSRAA